jgi:signal transduction histidine kinase
VKNMRQRAATIGGAFSLTSVPGKGTAVEVVLRA